MEGRVALVTGGGGAIGLAISRRLSAAGARVLVNDLKDYSREAAQEVGGEFLQADLSSMEETRDLGRRAVEVEGRVDILVNNPRAGGHPIQVGVHIRQARHHRPHEDSRARGRPGRHHRQRDLPYVRANAAHGVPDSRPGPDAWDSRVGGGGEGDAGAGSHQEPRRARGGGGAGHVPRVGRSPIDNRCGVHHRRRLDGALGTARGQPVAATLRNRTVSPPRSLAALRAVSVSFKRASAESPSRG